MPKIRYLRGSYQGPHFNAELSHLAQTVLDGNYNSGNLEKLRGWPLWSLRIGKIGKKEEAVSGKEGRFIFGMVDGFLIAVGYAKKHNYRDYLNKPTIKRYLSQVMRLKSMPDLSEAHFEDSPDDTFREFLRAALATPSEKPKIIDFYKEDWIELNDLQEQSLSLPTPCFISGSGGTGKSCLVIPLLLSYLQHRPPVEEENVLPYALYVTQTPHLVNDMKKTWESHPGTSEIAVHWMTYDDLLKTFGNVEGKTLVYRDHFDHWFSTYKPKEERNARTLGGETPKLSSSEVYQEFRILSAHQYREDPNKYLSAGKDQSFIPVELRPWMSTAFNHYLASLEQSKQVNPDLYFFKPSFVFSFVAADEAQNFSNGQLDLLALLSRCNTQKKPQLVLLGDPLQSTFDKKAVNLAHAMLMHDMKRRGAYMQLTVNYRSPLAGIAAANCIISAMQRMAGGLGSRYETRYIDGPKDKTTLGHFYFITPEEAPRQPWLMAVTKKLTRKDSAQLFCAVVTLSEYKKEAEALFPQALVLTIQEAQGLSFSVVVSYKLFQSSEFKDAKKRFEEAEDKQPTNRPKANQEDLRFSGLMQSIYTLVTRCEDRLVFCEKYNPHASFLYDQLYGMRSMEWPTDEELLSNGTEGSDHDLILSAYMAGNRSLACTLFTTRLQRPREEFEAYIEQHSNPQPRALEAAFESKVPLCEQSPRLFAPLKSQHPKFKQVSTSNHPAPLEASDLYSSFEESLLALYLNQYGINFLLMPFNDQNHRLLDRLNDPDQRILFMRAVLNFYDQEHEILLNKIDLEKIRKFFLSSNKKDLLNDINELAQHKKEWVNFQRDRIKKELSAPTRQKSQQKYILPHRYIDTGNLKGLHQLFKLGVNFNSENRKPLVPYLITGQQKFCPTILEFLCHSAQADIDARLAGRTALHYACIKIDLDKVKSLLDLGANVNAVDHDRKTPLYFAFHQGNPLIIDLLLKSGASQSDPCILDLISDSVNHDKVNILKLLARFMGVALPEPDANLIIPAIILNRKNTLLKALKENDKAGENSLNYSLLSAIDRHLFAEARLLISAGANWDQPLTLTPDEQRRLIRLPKSSGENLTITPKEFSELIKKDRISLFERVSREQRRLKEKIVQSSLSLAHCQAIIKTISLDILTHHDVISLHHMPVFQDTPANRKRFGAKAFNTAILLQNKLRIIRHILNQISLPGYDETAMKLVRNRAMVKYHVGQGEDKCIYILFKLLRRFYDHKITVPINIFNFSNHSSAEGYYGIIIGEISICGLPQDFDKFLFIDPLLNVIGSTQAIYLQHKEILHAYNLRGFLELSMTDLPGIRTYTPDEQTIALITRMEESAHRVSQFLDKQLESHSEYSDFFKGTKVKPPHQDDTELVNKQKEDYFRLLKHCFPDLNLDVTANYQPPTPVYPPILELFFEEKAMAEKVHSHLRKYVEAFLKEKTSESKEVVYTLSLYHPDTINFRKIPKLYTKEPVESTSPRM